MHGCNGQEQLFTTNPQDVIQVPQPALQLVVWLSPQHALVLSIMDHKVVLALPWELVA